MDITRTEIANALTSAAKNHIVALSEDVYDNDTEKYQSEINLKTKNIYENVIVGTNVYIGSNVNIYGLTTIESGVALGADTKIGSNVNIEGGISITKNDINKWNNSENNSGTNSGISDININKLNGIHENVTIGTNTKIGETVNIGNNYDSDKLVNIGTDIFIDSHVNIEQTVVIKSSVTIGNFVSIGTQFSDYDDGVNIGTNVKIDHSADIGYNTKIDNNIQMYNDSGIIIKTSDISEHDITIGTKVYIGKGSSIDDGINISLSETDSGASLRITTETKTYEVILTEVS